MLSELKPSSRMKKDAKLPAVCIRHSAEWKRVSQVSGPERSTFGARTGGRSRRCDDAKSHNLEQAHVRPISLLPLFHRQDGNRGSP
jgi:hypothetical protein